MNKRTIYVFLSAILSWSLVRHSVLFIDPMSHAILEGSRGSPFQYRVLWPHIYVALLQLIHEPHVVTWLLWLLLFALVAITLDEYCRYWFDEKVVWGWVVVTMAILAGTHHFELGYDLWSLAEVLFITVALLLLQRKREGWLIPLIFIATLNRETGGIIVLLALLVTRRIKLPVVLGMVWTITYGSIRLYYGPQRRVITVTQLLQHNLSVSSLLLFGAGALLFGWFFWTAWKGRVSAPGMAQRVAWATFVYLPFVAVWGSWQEWRLYMSLYPILLPLVIVAGGDKHGDLWAWIRSPGTDNNSSFEVSAQRDNKESTPVPDA